MRRPSTRSWRHSAPSSPCRGSRSRSPVVRTVSHFACWPIAGLGRGAARLSASPSIIACAPESGAEAAQVRRWLTDQRNNSSNPALAWRPPGHRASRTGTGRATRTAHRLVPARRRAPSAARTSARGSGGNRPATVRPWQRYRRAGRHGTGSPGVGSGGWRRPFAPPPASRVTRCADRGLGSLGSALESTTPPTAILATRARAWQRHWHTSGPKG